MACRVAHSPVVKLWMASQSLCKQVPLERWSGLKAGSHVAEELAGCWRTQMPAVALKQLRRWLYCSPYKDSLRSVSLRSDHQRDALQGEAGHERFILSLKTAARARGTISSFYRR